jgi:chlorophyllide a reductase subunit Y
MRDFFGDVGAGPNAGVWEATPVDRPQFRAKYAAQRIAAAKAAEAVGS